MVRRTPFTIQLTIATGESKQPVSLGVDAGYKHVGLSASTEKAELYASEVELRKDITDLVRSRGLGDVYKRQLLVARYGSRAVTAKRATAHRGSTTASAPSAKAGLHRRLKTESTRICRA